jgi:hypothetical protein
MTVTQNYPYSFWVRAETQEQRDRQARIDFIADIAYDLERERKDCDFDPLD